MPVHLYNPLINYAKYQICLLKSSCMTSNINLNIYSVQEREHGSIRANDMLDWAHEGITY